MEAPFSHLSIEKRQLLRDYINKEWDAHVSRLEVKDAVKPSKRIEQWNNMEKLSNSLGKMVAEMEIDVAYVFDQETGHPLSRQTPTAEEMQNEHQALDLRMRSFLVSTKVLLPSIYARSFVVKAKQNLQAIESVCRRGRDFEETLKSTGTPVQRLNHLRYMFVYILSSVFTKIFEAKPLATVGGPWEFFLAEVLSHLEKKTLSPGGAHSLWRDVRKFVDADAHTD